MELASRPSAFQRRLRDTPRERWAWALGSSVPLIGVVVLVKHGLSRRTVKPAVYGVTALGAMSFMLAATVPVILPPGPLGRSRGGAMAAAVALAVGAFALGHRSGQERDAREARKWLELER
jgi:hypothetical protein